MNFFDNFTIDNAKHKFKTEYGTALLAVLPLILLGIFSYASEEWFGFKTYTNGFQVLLFVLSGIAGFLTYNFALMNNRGNQLSLREAFEPQTKIVYYFVYAAAVYGINYVFALWIGNIDLSLLDTLVEPFGEFLFNANSTFGFIIRFMIVLNIMVFLIVEIGILIFHKFVFVPFLICDNENPVEATINSWNNSTPHTGLIIKCLNYIYFVAAIVFNILIFVLMIVLMNDPFAVGFTNFMTYLMVAAIWFYIYPLAYTVLAELFTTAN